MPNHNFFLLLIVTFVWGTTFPLLKHITTTLSGAEISTFRFCVAALCMVPFALHTPRAAWRDGALLGAVALVSYVAQAVGLAHISANRSAFLTSLSVLMVPFLGLALGGRITAQIALAALLACLGIGCLSWEGSGNWIGDSATLVCALAYAVYVIMLSRCAGRHDPRALAAAQIVLMAVFGMLWLFGSGLFDSARLITLPQRLTPTLPVLVYLGVIATAGMLFLQALGQRGVPAEKAVVIYAMEPVFAAMCSWGLLGESLGLRGMAGGLLVVVAVIVSEWRFAPHTSRLG